MLPFYEDFEDKTFPPEKDEQETLPEDYEDNMTDAEADADTLASAGYGTDEDYGDFGQEDSPF